MKKKKKFRILLAFVLIVTFLCASVPVRAAHTGLNAGSSTGDARCTALVLDMSISVLGTPLKKIKEGAKVAAETLMTSENDYIAVIAYGSRAKVLCEYTNDLDEVVSAIENLGVWGLTNMEAGLEAVKNLSLPYGYATVKKNILLCADGIPQSGNTLEYGKYDEDSMGKSYKYVNAAYEMANELKDSGYKIYGVGYYHNLYDDELDYGKRMISDISSTGCSCYTIERNTLPQILKEVAQKIQQGDIKEQTISAKNIKSEYANNKKINLKATAKTKLAYASSNKKVAIVSSKGIATIKGIGKTTITIKAAQTAQYKAATKKITLTVLPKKNALTTCTSAAKGKLTMVWKKDSKATGYEIQIAKNSKFTSGKQSKTTGSSRISAKGLTSGKYYYVRVRTYTNVGTVRYSGPWSTVKKVKIK